MAKVDLAKKKWERKMANAGRKWKANVSGKDADYKKGIAEFLGVSPDAVNPDVVSSWREGVDLVTESDFQSAVSGKGDKWERKYRDAMLGR